MGETKPMASLSSTLLARKGQAKPAMRPQGFASFGFGMPQVHDDLGWNDMGGDPAMAPMAYAAPPAEVMSLVPPSTDLATRDTAREAAAVADAPASDAAVEAVLYRPVFDPPAVVRQQQALERDLRMAAAPSADAPSAQRTTVDPDAASPAATIAASTPQPHAALAAVPVSPSTATGMRAAPGSKGRAAFTLRLDPDRHLRLRLACAVAHRSAQAVVVDALDAFLNSQMAVTELARAAATQTDAGREAQL